MRSERDIEAYLGRMSRSFQSVDGRPGTYFVGDGGDGKMPPIVLRVDPPLVVMRVNIGQAHESLALYKKLLTLNAESHVHTSFGLEDDRIVLCAALELENLDFNELEAAIAEMDLTLVEQVPNLSELSKKDL